tara:strand:- start:134 stop:1894 length:1761 start_codon:yes stop_codon:yes gene_type:complete
MATTQQRAQKYAEWLVSNKDKQGSPEWNTVSQAYKEIRTGMKEPLEKEQIEPKAIDMADITQSGYSGIIRGVEAVASLPDLAAQGIGFLLEKPMGLLGFERMTKEERMSLPGYVDIQKEVIEPTATALGARYQPKTVAGELAQRTGELLPFAGARPLTFAAAPAAAGYAAEKTAEKAGAGEGLQLAARIAGEVAAPVPTAKTLETIKAVTDLRKTKNLKEIANTSGLSETQSTRIKRAANLEDQGIKVSTGQALGDQSLLRSEARSTGGEEFAKSQLQDFTSAVMNKIGSTSKIADSSALVEAQTRIGGMMNDVISGTNVKFSAGDARRSSKALQNFKKLKPTGVEIEDMSNYFALVNRRIADAIRANPLQPDEYISFRQELSRMTTSPKKPVKDTAIEMLDIIDEAMNKTLSDLDRSSDFTKLKNARSMYRDYLAVERAATAAKGDLLSPSQMASALKMQSKRQYAQRQRGDLGNLVANADELLKFPATSGSAENLAAIIGPTVTRYGTRGVAGYQAAQLLGLPGEVGVAVATIGPATFDKLALTDKGRQYLIKKMVESDPTFFTPENARMFVGVIANAMKSQEQ